MNGSGDIHAAAREMSATLATSYLWSHVSENLPLWQADNCRLRNRRFAPRNTSE